MNNLKAYKLFRELKDGSIAPLFINKKLRIPIGEWMQAECHPTKGFTIRPFWHCTSLPIAPHLSMKGRSWYEIEMENFTNFQRPTQQGGLWFLAERIKVIKKVLI